MCRKIHDTINPPKRATILNSHNSPILHGCMNNRKGKARFNFFRILLDSGCSSMIVMISLVKKLSPEEDAPMQWHTQAGNITTNINV